MPIDATDGEPPLDAPVVIDAAPPDTDAPGRTRADLIGLWEFNETSGTTVNDTSDVMDKEPLTVSVGNVTFADGTMTTTGVSVIQSDRSPHLNRDVGSSRAVTLEAWVMASAASQGSLAAPVVVAGLSSSINARNISILQAGTKWLARVRTNLDMNGKPDLVAVADVVPGVMTHVVVVADATQRILYVDSTAVDATLAPTPPVFWDQAYRMLLGNEVSQSRQWLGTFALVAMYDRALPKGLIDTNFKAGPSGK